MWMDAINTKRKASQVYAGRTTITGPKASCDALARLEGNSEQSMLQASTHVNKIIL